MMIDIISLWCSLMLKGFLSSDDLRMKKKKKKLDHHDYHYSRSICLNERFTVCR